MSIAALRKQAERIAENRGDYRKFKEIHRVVMKPGPNGPVKTGEVIIRKINQ